MRQRARSTEKQTVPTYVRLSDLLSFDYDGFLKKKWVTKKWPTKLYGRYKGGPELIEIKIKDIKSLILWDDGGGLYSNTYVPCEDIWTDISVTYEDSVDLLKKLFVFDNLIKSLDRVKRED